MNTNEMFNRICQELAEIRALLAERTDEIMDVDAVRELTGLSRSAIYQKTSSRHGEPPELPHYKTGKRLYFKRSEIVQWMTQNKVKDRAAYERAAVQHCLSSR